MNEYINFLSRIGKTALIYEGGVVKFDEDFQLASINQFAPNFINNSGISKVLKKMNKYVLNCLESNFSDHELVSKLIVSQLIFQKYFLKIMSSSYESILN